MTVQPSHWADAIRSEHGEADSLRDELHPIPRSFDSIQLRLDLSNALELNVAGLLHSGYTVAESVQDRIPFVQGVDDAGRGRADRGSAPKRA